MQRAELLLRCAPEHREGHLVAVEIARLIERHDGVAGRLIERTEERLFLGQLRLLSLDAFVGPEQQDIQESQQRGQKNQRPSNRHDKVSVERRLCRGNVEQDDQVAHLGAGDVGQRVNQHSPRLAVEGCFRSHIFVRMPRLIDEAVAFGREPGQGGIDQHFVWEPVPVGLPAQHLHARFPRGSIQHVFFDGHCQFETVFLDNIFQNILDLLAQLEVADEGVAIKDRPHHAQGERAQRPQLDTRHQLLGALCLERGETVDQIAGLARLMHPQQVHAVGTLEVEVRDAILGPESIEEGLILRQKPVSVPRLERIDQRCLADQAIFKGGQHLGVVEEKFLQIV